jgi:serine/threonine protein kinase
MRWGDLNRAFTGAGTITKSTVQLGSWNYMSPEQIEDAHEATAASDIYSLGITCLELLEGEPPTPHRVSAGKIGKPSGVDAMDHLLNRMTAYDPDRRASLDEIENVLRQVATDVSRKENTAG